MNWEDQFSTTIVIGKFLLLIFLLILSFINGHKEYIQYNPRKFMWDSFTVGISSALAVAIIAQMRGVPEIIPNVAFISFFLFFSYNVFRELSGFNVVTDSGKLTQGESRQVRLFSVPFAILALTTLACLVVMATMARVAHPYGLGQLLIESVIFGGFTGLAEIVVAKNHGETTMHSIQVGGLNFMMFTLGFILLQYGGFNNHVFSHPCT